MAAEDLIFASLGLVLVLLGGFCLGVERGKGLVAPAESPKPALLAFDPGQGEFAIQLATYGELTAAEEEAKRLRKRGVNAQVIRQGRYFELRVAGYRSRFDAQGLLEDFRKTYRDSFVKRVQTSLSNKT
ncbi:MAG: SPOR domain-containing protein [Candidatus Omnitrophica bacterium]|nr:SPOR domain-containing protein [Candidatus Omnitrophota bacterium]